jgi:hypothetical protein
MIQRRSRSMMDRGGAGLIPYLFAACTITAFLIRCPPGARAFMKPIYFALVLLLLSASASAEMEKTALSCETGMCLRWWPKLPHIEGWHQDREQSYNYRANALAPDGFTFADAETVMYATALFKPRIPETRSLEMLIANDKSSFW